MWRGRGVGAVLPHQAPGRPGGAPRGAGPGAAARRRRRSRGRSRRGRRRGPGEAWQSEGRRDGGARADEVGADDTADGRRPDDDGQVTPAVGRQREVGRGIPGLVVGRRGAPEQQARDQEEREAADDARDDQPEGAGESEDVPEDEAGAAASCGHEADHGNGDEGRAEDLEGAAEAGPAGRARDLLGEERPDGDAGREADAAEHLRADEGGDGAALSARTSAAQGHSVSMP